MTKVLKSKQGEQNILKISKSDIGSQCSEVIMTEIFLIKK